MIEAEVRPATLVEVLETIAEAFDLRAHTIAERYDDIDDWETKMALAEARAASVREAVSVIKTSQRALQLLVADVEGYAAWERPCYALDEANDALHLLRFACAP